MLIVQEIRNIQGRSLKAFIQLCTQEVAFQKNSNIGLMFVGVCVCVKKLNRLLQNEITELWAL